MATTHIVEAIVSQFHLCRHNHDTMAVIKVAVPEGCRCFPDDREQWLCMQHFLRLIDMSGKPFTVLEDLYKCP